MQTSISELLVEAANLMVVGMVVVFVFLTLLIGAVNLIAAVNRRFPEEVISAPSARSPRNTVKENTNSSVPVAAITAAVHQYRKNRKS
ncbi:OadG family protein [Aliiglaciecola lipolytica]|uniref:Probable oxaloacetate decarboxylase gamma chain n=1 Tax=Aliiglaciecola lipolytica E3 TaxID=1127673 RepID=K6X0A0_9ALTE|nr:OadG family transporter subunit [Aliiglaciecola lipolytica]GAC14099.1 probable oxaloacetate decarboxylase gamma chain [Aliiglaciecola lipolytica E3]